MVKNIEQCPGWDGRIDRIAAEQLLQGKRIGSYLLRKSDEIADAIVSQLSATNHLAIKSYLCTVVESQNKIADVLILHNPKKGWTVYQDNPDLSDSAYRYYSSAKDLLAHHHHLKYPLAN
jgi:hypothetical protein